MKKKLLLKQAEKDYAILISELSELAGLIDHHKDVMSKYYEVTRPENVKLFLDIPMGRFFTYPSPKTGKDIFGKVYEVNFENLNKRIALIQRKINNYFIALCYESFEKFLRSVTARTIISNIRKAIEEDERLGFRSFVSCSAFLKTQFRDNNQVLKLLRRLNYNLDNEFKTNKKFEKYLEFYRTYSICRHHIIHSNDLIFQNSFKKLGTNGIKISKQNFGLVKSSRKNQYVIDTSQTSVDILKTTAQLAYLIFESHKK